MYQNFDRHKKKNAYFETCSAVIEHPLDPDDTQVLFYIISKMPKKNLSILQPNLTIRDWSMNLL